MMRRTWIRVAGYKYHEGVLHCYPGPLICMEDESDQTYLSGGGWDGVREQGMCDECSKFGPVS